MLISLSLDFSFLVRLSLCYEYRLTSFKHQRHHLCAEWKKLYLGPYSSYKFATKDYVFCAYYYDIIYMCMHIAYNESFLHILTLILQRKLCRQWEYSDNTENNQIKYCLHFIQRKLRSHKNIQIKHWKHKYAISGKWIHFYIVNPSCK